MIAYIKSIQLDEVMVEEPPAHLDCVAQERVGVVVGGVLHVGEGVVVAALNGEGVGVDKGRLARLVLQPVAACS